MPRLTPVPWSVLECIFLRFGFRYDRTKGDHNAYVKSGVLRPVIIPKYPEIDIEIIKSNMKTAGMSRDEYFAFLDLCK